MLSNLEVHLILISASVQGSGLRHFVSKLLLLEPGVRGDLPGVPGAKAPGTPHELPYGYRLQ